MSTLESRGLTVAVEADREATLRVRWLSGWT